MLGCALLFFLCLQSSEEADVLRYLGSADPEMRAAGAVIAGKREIYRAIPILIKLLGDEHTRVKTSAHDALRTITGEDIELNPQAWNEWWTTTGRNRFPIAEAAGAVDQLRTEIGRQVENLKGEVEGLKQEIRRSTTLVWTSLFISLGLWAVFIIAILYFTGHLASKLKEWKEVMKQADHYLRESERVTERTDRVLDELEAKKTEILEFFAKLKDDNEAEMERFTDLLEQNTEHHLRLEVMTLRQKAEKELEQTLADLKSSLEQEIRRVASQHREQMEAELARKFDAFRMEAEAQTLLLEANFLAAHTRQEEALRLYRRVVEMQPGNHVAWLRMANALRDLSRYEEALDAYRRALAGREEDPETHYHMAAMYARMRKKEPMLQALAVAFRSNGEFKDEALNDPAFKPYWEDAEFKDLAEV